ncbi:thioesterase family protein [Halioxenophilus sp. WMMB6]|uniref:acyl-CoA thioesterase n=1 Tax=Halioxenophilus sp. WMMB6 TaxID=3073815 RepID=UPI00295E25CE|nr:thioesterase family protein [Halioxenophilus sp. WMMB6]
MFKKTPRVEVPIKIPFYDVDQMRIVWHGHYVKYFERARCELLDLFDYGYASMEQSGYLWPIIDLRAKYIKSATFNQVIVVVAELVEYENRLKINYEILDQASGQRLHKAHSIQVAVAMASGEMQYVSPAIVKERLQCYGYL